MSATATTTACTTMAVADARVPRFCSNCGATIGAQARFCTHCGTRLGGQAAPASGTPVALPVSPPLPTHAAAAPPATLPRAAVIPTTGAPSAGSGVSGVAPAGGLDGTSVGNGRYAVERLLGRGGMSAVYLARDIHLGHKHVAVKEMIDTFASPEERAEAERDFAREADLLAALRHPAIPAILDRFSESRRHVLVMEYIAGESLETKLLTHGPYEEEQVRAWALALCPVLSYLHAQTPPVVFRDLKPGNIMVQPDGTVRLIDFGIARLFKGGQKADTVALGTSGYASPEHYTGQTDGRSDIYSLGATLHHLLTGRDPSKQPPFAFPPVRSLVPEISPDFAAAVDRALKSDRDKRFATVEEMRKALEPRRRRSGGKSAATAGGAQVPPSVAPATQAPVPVPVPVPGTPISASTPAAATPVPPAPRQGVVPAPPRPGTAAPGANGSTAPVPPGVQGALPAASLPRALVLEAMSPNRRIDPTTVAARLVALIGGDEGVIRAELVRGLPLVLSLPLRPGSPPPIAQDPVLPTLGVRARIVAPGTVPVLLDNELRRRLNTTRQLVVRDVIVGTDRICRCRRCTYSWRTNKPAGDPVPLRCPNCRSLEWGRWRILKCAWCGHEFDTADVHTRQTTRLFPTCPCCGLTNWETGRAPARTGWLDRLLAVIAGTT